MSFSLPAAQGQVLRGKLRPPIRHQDESEEFNIERLQRRLEGVLQERTRLMEQMYLAQIKACYYGFRTKHGQNYHVIASRIGSELETVHRALLQVKSRLFAKGVGAAELARETESALHLNAYESAWFAKLKNLAGERETVERHDLRLALPERSFEFGSIFKVFRALSWYGLDIVFAQRKHEPLRRFFNEIDQFADPKNEETRQGFETIECLRSLLQQSIISASELNSHILAALSVIISENYSLTPLLDDFQILNRRFLGLSLRGQTAALEKIMLEVRVTRPSFAEDVATAVMESSTAIKPDLKHKIKSLLDRIAEIKATVVRNHVSICVFFASSYFARGLEIADILQEACMGLMDAVDRYDFNDQATFRGYSAFWIKQRILRAIANQSRLIRLPVHVHYQVVKAIEDEQIQTDAADELLMPDTPPFTENEIVGFSAIPERDLFRIGYYCDGESELDTATVGDLEEVVSAVLATLDARQKSIIKLRFGFDGQPPLTLEEVGTEYGLTRERIRQIESMALKKLRHPARAKILASAR